MNEFQRVIATTNRIDISKESKVKSPYIEWLQVEEDGVVVRYDYIKESQIVGFVKFENVGNMPFLFHSFYDDRPLSAGTNLMEQMKRVENAHVEANKGTSVDLTGMNLPGIQSIDLFEYPKGGREENADLKVEIKEHARIRLDNGLEIWVWISEWGGFNVFKPDNEASTDNPITKDA